MLRIAVHFRIIIIPDGYSNVLIIISIFGELLNSLLEYLSMRSVYRYGFSIILSSKSDKK
jgi:hypothetical protein